MPWSHKFPATKETHNGGDKETHNGDKETHKAVVA